MRARLLVVGIRRQKRLHEARALRSQHGKRDLVKRVGSEARYTPSLALGTTSVFLQPQATASRFGHQVLHGQWFSSSFNNGLARRPYTVVAAVAREAEAGAPTSFALAQASF